ncbi:hypothetical protein Tco_0874092 [Tanacetum coccineum]|uniref:Uncharacterized protein n=1 Tax=Tanacetum coccineum TaxID=301880 RepID=A0ABQ5BL10_9ASTR
MRVCDVGRRRELVVENIKAEMVMHEEGIPGDALRLCDIFLVCVGVAGSSGLRFAKDCVVVSLIGRQEVWNDGRSCKVRVRFDGTCCGERLYCLVEDGDDILKTDPKSKDGSTSRHMEDDCDLWKEETDPILALPKGADDFVVYYDAQSKDLEVCLEKGEGDCLYVATTEGSYEGLHG